MFGVRKGTCGEHLTWILKDGVLTIDGIGEMQDFRRERRKSGSSRRYSSSSQRVSMLPHTPWRKFCKEIKSVRIQPNVTGIGDYAFGDCEMLTQISIPADVTRIGDHAFYHTRLTNIYYSGSKTQWIDKKFHTPEGVKLHVIAEASGNCGRNLTWKLSKGVLTISGTGEMYSYFDSPWYQYRYDIQRVHIQSGVTSIGSSAFNGCTELSEIQIPGSVTSIGSNAFYWCVGLTEINIPYGVTSIGPGAFFKCKKLSAIDIPSSVASIDAHAFSITSLKTVNYSGTKAQWSKIQIDKSNDSLVKYSELHCTDDDPTGACGKNLNWILSDGVLTIKGTGEMDDFDFAPWHAKNVRTVQIQNGITSIGRCAFYGCEKLSAIDIPSSVASIGDYAFFDCKSLTAIDIPSSVTSIGDHAFSDCSSLTAVQIPDSVTSIGDYAFSCCVSLTKIRLSDHITSIGDYAFYYCKSLTKIYIPDGITSIGSNAFSTCFSLKEIKLSCSINAIESDVFSFCGMTAIQIPNTVASIHTRAFRSCKNLTSVSIPSSVKCIEKEAFYECKNLKNVYYSGSETQWDRIMRYSGNDCLAEATVHFESAGLVLPTLNAVDVSTRSVLASEQKPVPYSGSKPYIFFSYCHKDMEPTLKLIRLLQNDGFRVWYDEGIEPGTEFPKYIADHLDGCSCVVSLLSEAYLNSDFCKRESLYAVNHKIQQVVVYSRNISLTGDWELMISIDQAIPNDIYQDERRFLQKFRQTSGIDQCRKN